MRQFRLNILRLQQVKRQTSDKCTELRLRLLIICALELRRGVIILIAVVVVIQTGIMWREGLQFVKSAVFHLRLLRLGNVFLFLNKDRSFIWPDFAVLSRVYRWLNMQGALHVVQWNILHRFYSEIQYLASEELLSQLLLLQVCQRTKFSGLEWDAMTFWIALHCIDCTTCWTKTPYWPLIERGCENPTWYSAERSVTLHSFDFTKYRLWTSLFWRGTIVNGQIVVCSFDLTEYHL